MALVPQIRDPRLRSAQRSTPENISSSPSHVPDNSLTALVDKNESSPMRITHYEDLTKSVETKGIPIPPQSNPNSQLAQDVHADPRSGNNDGTRTDSKPDLRNDSRSDSRNVHNSSSRRDTKRSERSKRSPEHNRRSHRNDRRRRHHSRSRSRSPRSPRTRDRDSSRDRDRRGHRRDDRR